MIRNISAISPPIFGSGMFPLTKSPFFLYLPILTTKLTYLPKIRGTHTLHQPGTSPKRSAFLGFRYLASAARRKVSKNWYLAPVISGRVASTTNCLSFCLSSFLPSFLPSFLSSFLLLLLLLLLPLLLLLLLLLPLLLLLLLLLPPLLLILPLFWSLLLFLFLLLLLLLLGLLLLLVLISC